MFHCWPVLLQHIGRYHSVLLGAAARDFMLKQPKQAACCTVQTLWLIGENASYINSIYTFVKHSMIERLILTE